MSVTVTVVVPSALRRFADGQARVEVDMDSADPTVAEVLGALRQSCPGVCERALDEHGAVRRHVNLFVNSESIRHTGGLATPVRAGDEITIMPAVSGG